MSSDYFNIVLSQYSSTEDEKIVFNGLTRKQAMELIEAVADANNDGVSIYIYPCSIDEE